MKCSHGRCNEVATVGYYWPEHGPMIACLRHGRQAIRALKKQGITRTLYKLSEDHTTIEGEDDGDS